MSDDPLAAPIDTFALFGHREVEDALLRAYQSGKMPHAFLIGGTQGIGKALLARRFARFVLANPDPSSRQVQNAITLDVPENDVTARRMIAQSHDGLLTLAREADDKGKMRTAIVVDQVRRTVPFFGATANNAGWRVCVVDAVEDLKWPEAPNALLKILEEPPPRSLFLLVSHKPGRVLPTILSRCRQLMLRGLDGDDMRAALAYLTGRHQSDPELKRAAGQSEGSVARALTMLEGDSLALTQRIDDLLAALPALDPLALHDLSDRMGIADRASLQLFHDMVDQWLSARLHPARRDDLEQLAQIAHVWEKVGRAAREADAFNLERKPFVFATFNLLAGLASSRPASPMTDPQRIA